MELFVSEPSKPLDVALRELERSYAVVLILDRLRFGGQLQIRPHCSASGSEPQRDIDKKD
jgi:hypothetical protein